MYRLGGCFWNVPLVLKLTAFLRGIPESSSVELWTSGLKKKKNEYFLSKYYASRTVLDHCTGLSGCALLPSRWLLEGQGEEEIDNPRSDNYVSLGNSWVEDGAARSCSHHFWFIISFSSREGTLWRRYPYPYFSVEIASLCPKLDSK